MNKGLLTVEAIWFLAKSVAANPKASHPAYLKEAVAKKFTAISMVDRKDLVDYITGKTETSANIDITCLLYTSPSPRDGLLSRMPSSA